MIMEGVVRDAGASINIGEVIRRRLEERHFTVVALARALNCSRSYVYKILARPSIDVMMLYKICRVLHYDFFAEFTENVRKI